MAERNIGVDHVTIWRWVQRYASELHQLCRSELRMTNRAYTEACCELEKYRNTFEPPYSSRPASGLLLVSFSKVTRHLLTPFALTCLAESLPNNANDYARLMLF